MAKLKILNAKQIQTHIRKMITKEMRAKEVSRGVANIVVDDIKDSKLGTPAPFTKDMRAYLEQTNKTDPKYKRSKISANFTGELLQDLISNVRTSITKGDIFFVLEHSNKSHKQYKQPKGKSRFSKKKTHKETRFDKKTGTNKTVNRATKIPYKFISTQLIKRLGYDYMKMSVATKAKVTAFIRKKIYARITRK